MELTTQCPCAVLLTQSSTKPELQAHPKFHFIGLHSVFTTVSLSLLNNIINLGWRKGQPYHHLRLWEGKKYFSIPCCHSYTPSFLLTPNLSSPPPKLISPPCKHPTCLLRARFSLSVQWNHIKQLDSEHLHLHLAEALLLLFPLLPCRKTVAPWPGSSSTVWWSSKR